MKTPAQSSRDCEVSIGKSNTPVGHLTFTKHGRRLHSAFVYLPSWLSDADRFTVSPDLPLVAGYQAHRAVSEADSVFAGAFADTAPDAWGRRVIARAHARQRKAQSPYSESSKTPSSAQALTEMDYLLAVDDFSRVGALRLLDPDAAVGQPQRRTPPLLELPRMLAASRAVELGEDTAEDLKYLQGKGTSLGGMRPKCTLLDEAGRLALAKFPSVADARSVTRGEVLALRLAAMAGIDAAQGRVLEIEGSAVAVVQRFDRTVDGARTPYLSAASMLQARRDEERAYTEIADAIRATCADPIRDCAQLWRRMLFNLLITNVDDHLQNLGFLYAGRGQWRLAPAFDLNPFPDKDRESKTWLTEAEGPVTSVDALLAHASYFGLNDVAAREVVTEVVGAVNRWRTVATSRDVGLGVGTLADFAAAFEHEALDAAMRFA